MFFTASHRWSLLALASLAACGGGSGDAPSPGVSASTRVAGPASVVAAGVDTSTTLTVRASATLAAGVGPRLNVRVDGQLLRPAGVEVSNVNELQDYVFSAGSLPAGARIDLVFDNDAVIGSEDRNLIVDSLSVGSTILKPEQATIDRGLGLEAFDGQNTVPGQAWLAWDGAMRFVLPGGSANEVIVYALGSSAGGVAPAMRLRVNGEELSPSPISVEATDSPRAYRFAASAAVTPGTRLDVIFDNDAVIGTEDRNLIVTGIEASGTQVPGRSGTLDRGQGAAAFDGVDLMPGQNWLAWDGALRLVWPGAPSAVPTWGNVVTVRAASPNLTFHALQVFVDGRSTQGVQTRAQPDPRYYGLTMPSSLGDLSFASPTPILPGSRIDLVVASPESNPIVESIVVNGVRIAAGDEGVIFDRGTASVFDETTQGSAFDGLDTVPGASLINAPGALRFTAPDRTLLGPGEGQSPGSLTVQATVTNSAARLSLARRQTGSDTTTVALPLGTSRYTFRSEVAPWPYPLGTRLSVTPQGGVSVERLGVNALVLGSERADASAAPTLTWTVPDGSASLATPLRIIAGSAEAIETAHRLALRPFTGYLAQEPRLDTAQVCPNGGSVDVVADGVTIMPGDRLPALQLVLPPSLPSNTTEAHGEVALITVTYRACADATQVLDGTATLTRYRRDLLNNAQRFDNWRYDAALDLRRQLNGTAQRWSGAFSRAVATNRYASTATNAFRGLTLATDASEPITWVNGTATVNLELGLGSNFGVLDRVLEFTADGISTLSDHVQLFDEATSLYAPYVVIGDQTVPAPSASPSWVTP